MLLSIEHAGRRLENFTREGLIEAGVPADLVAAAELEAAKAQAQAAIDAAAAAARARYLTLIPGQELTTHRKVEEARAFDKLTAAAKLAADPLAFPMLAPEAAAVGSTIGELAAVIVGKDRAWSVIAGKIEAARVGGKADVRARLKPHTVAEALAAAVTALNAF